MSTDSGVQVRHDPPPVVIPEPPPEPVVFLTPVMQTGERLLYVTDELGVEGGFLDLGNAQIRPSSPKAEPILEALLPHYLADRSQAPKQKRRKRRTPAPVGPLVVGYHWVGEEGGPGRLFVHRRDPEGHITDLGSFDLADQKVLSPSPQEAETVHYCGLRYLAVRQGR